MRVSRFALVFATLTAAFYVVGFLILFVSLAVVGPLVPMIHQPTFQPAVQGAAILPILFVLIWLFLYPSAVLFCFLYNQVAKMTGGIEFSTF